MLTIFANPKPFDGHIGLIQRNAIESWTRLGESVQVLLLGNELGTAQVAQELGLQHIPDIACNDQGTPLISAVFEQGQRHARYDVVCYLNSDIILTQDFLAAVQQIIHSGKSRFLMIGRRHDTDVTRALDFSDADWAQKIRSFALETGRQRGPSGIDYFCFPKGLWGDIPDFAIGRVGWDNYMIYRALERQAMVVDATAVVLAIHQNHAYAHHPEGKKGTRSGREARQNIVLAGGSDHLFNIRAATHKLTENGIQRKWDREALRQRLKSFAACYPTWAWLSRLILRIWDAVYYRTIHPKQIPVQNDET